MALTSIRVRGDAQGVSTAQQLWRRLAVNNLTLLIGYRTKVPPIEVVTRHFMTVIRSKYHKSLFSIDIRS